VVAAGACAQSAPVKEHGPIYGDDAASDATADTGGGNDGGGPEAGDDATSDDGGGGSDAAGDSPAETGPGDAASDASAGGDGGSDAGANDAAGGGDASDAGSAADASDSGTSDASDGGSAPPDAGDGGGFVAPTCDGVIGAGEYGDATHQDGPTATGQTWYLTWNDTNLYVAIAGATVTEGNVIYLAPNPGDGGTGLTSGQPYDNTDITALPFAADLVVYGKDGYDDAQVVSNGAWGSPTASAIQVCTNGTTKTREEVIPWSLLGGRPASFGWLGYVAANRNNNAQGYIYGQMPTDDPGGAPANNLTYTRYFAVPDATPGVDAPFAHEQ